MGIIVALFEYYHNNVFTHISKNINIILFENCKGINPMGLNDSLEDY